MSFPVQSEESYRRAMEYIEQLDKQYGLDARDKWLIIKLYDDHYWLVREIERLNTSLATLNNNPAEDRPVNLDYDGRQGLSALIPASYKPMRWPLRMLRECTEDDDEA